MRTWTLILAVVLTGAVVAHAGDDAPTAPASLADLEAPGHRPVEPTVQDSPPLVVLERAHVWTAAGESWDRGYVVLEGGTIRALGAGDAPAVEGATVIDATDHWITPGIIDTHSHIGVYAAPGGSADGDGNEASSPTTAGVWAEHSLNPQDPGIQFAVAGGVTAIQVLPGSANLIGGRGFVVQMVPHRGPRAMRFPGAPETIKMACGENPKRVYGGKGGAPSTRMGSLRATRQAFLAAEEALRALEDWEEQVADGGGKKRKKKGDADLPDPPSRSLDTETLIGVLRGEILPQVHCYRADDMLAMLQLADEFGFSIRSFHHALEAYKIRDLLAEGDVAASTWADWWGFKLEAYDGIPHNAALLTEAGARAIIHSDSHIGIQRLNQEAGKAMHSGLQAGIELTEEDALKWITINAAWALGIDHLTGSLEVGKRADVVVWDGHPFSVYTSARLVFVEGVLRHDSEQEQTWGDFLVGQEVTP